MDAYVLGFAFDDLGRVALIEKQKPAWQRGLWNGIGGKIENGEAALYAMCREFLEETGVLITFDQWQYRGDMIGSVGFLVRVYTYTGPEVRQCRTMESETVDLWPLFKVSELKCIENVPALIALCRIPVAAPSNVFPTFVLSY